MPASEYDAIVVGASFAGLAVARQLRGRVLLLDRNEVGAVQTSACGTPLWVPQALGVEDSVLQVHDRLTVRTPMRSVTYDLSAVPFCTFDYKTFCRGLLAQCSARFLRAGVTGVGDGVVRTNEGSFAAPVIVDCSGWRGAVVNDGDPAQPRGCAYSFGLETRADLSDEGLHFWIDHGLIRRGLGWVFPVGGGSLIGLGSYVGVSKLKPALERFLASHGVQASTYHGTYFPNRLLRPTVGRVFAVGDAAGQCLPLTAEGIRPALYFGGECGKLVRRVLDGAVGLEQALAHYRGLVDGYRWAYRVLGAAQWVTAHAPTKWFATLAALATRPPFLPRWWPRYGWFGRIDAAVPAPTPP
jgi:flavin-dependent dehydrogenase